MRLSNVRLQHQLIGVAFRFRHIQTSPADEIFHDQGGYVRTHGANVPNRTMCMMTGPYKVPAYRASCHVRLTNKAPAATYRAPGRFETTFVRERLVDAIAHPIAVGIALGQRRLDTSCESCSHSCRPRIASC